MKQRNKEQKRKVHSIRGQFAWIFIGLMIGTILLCLMINYLFLGKVYMQSKLDVIHDAYGTIKQAAESDSYDTEEFARELDDVCRSYNMTVCVMDVNSNMKYVSINGGERLENRLIGYVFGLSIPFNDQRVIENGDDYVIKRTGQEDKEYLEIYGRLNTGISFIMQTPLSSIQESAKIANRFYALAGCLGAMAGGIIIWFVSRSVTKPILELNNISERMVQLDFEAKYQGKAHNEIDLLGENINKLSDSLEKTISELKTANNELQRDVEKKETIDEMRKEFLANVSHELKTPIALIQGYAEGLQEEINDDPESRQFYCDVIVDEAAKMNNMVKKLLTLALAGAMTLSLAACGSKSDDSSNDAQQGGDESGKTYKVAIIKQLDHASLDEIANAVAAELDKIAADNNVTIEYDITSGQNDQTILKQLSDQAIADQVDAIIPIATTAAQISALSAEDTKTPVVYAAVSDPEAASLTGIDYVTGTSDALNTSFIMDMIFAQNPDVAKVGLLYSLSEPNSTKPIADAKAYLDAKGIEYVEQTANTNDEVVAAASALIADGVDAVFTPTDNVIMAAELAIYEDLAKAGIPHYTGADSFVRNGAYATCGVNYTDLGAKTADLAYSAITDGMDAMEDYYLMDGGIITVNTDTAAAMSLDYSCFDSMGTVVEVTTTKN